VLRLEPMTEEEFAVYVAKAVRSYADAHVRAGDVEPEEALGRAQKDYDELLPEGLRSKNQHLFTVFHETFGAIGLAWFEFKERRGKKSAYLFDIELREDLRGQGLGRRALELVEEQMRVLGARSVGLNVFGYNHAARALYEKMGYQITGMGMKKELPA
jgi:ribosomal protein S18 acetylase RimI-like enzyme